jgi:hypothetical protein
MLDMIIVIANGGLTWLIFHMEMIRQSDGPSRERYEKMCLLSICSFQQSCVDLFFSSLLD